MRKVYGAVLAVALAATACGGGSTTAAGGGQPATEEGLKTAAKNYVQASISSDSSKMYDYLSAECKKRWGVADYAANNQAALVLSDAFMKVKVAEAKIGEVSTRNVTATSGEATVKLLTADGKPFYGESTSDDSFPKYVYEDGAWRRMECPKLGESSNTSNTSGRSGAGATSSATAIPEAKPDKDIEITDSGFSAIPSSSKESTFAVVIKNPNTNLAAYDVSINVSFLDANGGVVKALDSKIPVVLAGQQAAFAERIEVPTATKSVRG